jgi:hypothetical protein
LSTRLVAESELKYRTLLLAVLALSAGLLFVLVSTTPVARAQGGSVDGMVYYYDQYGDMHPMTWAQVTASGGGSSPIIAYTTDGTYSMWLPAGTYTITASGPTGPSGPVFFPQSASVVVSDGGSTSVDFYLKPTGNPVPEFPPWMGPIIILGTLMITVVAVRGQKSRTRN